MVRLDDNELNIHPQVAAALGHLGPQFVEAAVEPHIRTEQSDTWVFGAAVRFVAAVLVVAMLGWLYVLFTTAPQQGQLGASRTLGAATVAHSQAHRPPHPARRQHPRYKNRTSLRQAVPGRMSQSKSAYLPAEYDIGGTTSPTFLAREMPRGGAVDSLGYIPAGICLLYERANANGWRRVVSFDHRYAGYAQVYPTVTYQPRPMQPGFVEVIEMIRRIP